MKKIYHSKIGLELVLPLVLIFGAVLAQTITEKPSWIGIAILLLVILFVVYMFITTTYTIARDELTIKCGFLFTKSVFNLKFCFLNLPHRQAAKRWLLL